MTTINSPLATGNGGVPLVNSTELQKGAGFHLQLTRAQFDAAVTAERANITSNGIGLYSTGQRLEILGEIGYRTWFVGSSAANSHARTVVIPGGNQIVLANDPNTATTVASLGVAPTTGGNDGDLQIDSSLGSYYLKSSGTWSSAQTLALSSAELSAIRTNSLPVSTAQATAIALKAPTISPSFSGTVTTVGPILSTPTTMSALVIDVTKANNTKTLSTSSTLTFSATPADGTNIELTLANSSISPITVTLPTCYSQSLGASGAIGVTIPATPGYVTLRFKWANGVANVFGDAGINNPGNSVLTSRTSSKTDDGNVLELAAGVTYTISDATALSTGVTLIGPVSGTATIAVAGAATINGGTTSITITAGQVFGAIPRPSNASAFVVKGS